MYLKEYANHKDQTILDRDVVHHNVSCTRMAGVDWIFLAHLSHSDKVSFDDHILFVVRP